MTMHAAIRIVSITMLAAGIALLAIVGRVATPMAMSFIMVSVLGGIVATALQLLDARLKSLEERLAKCERLSAPPS
jgi:hypothetical protein